MSTFCLQFDELNKQVASSTEFLQTSKTEISDLKRTLQALQIELESQLCLVWVQPQSSPQLMVKVLSLISCA